MRTNHEKLHFSAIKRANDLARFNRNRYGIWLSLITRTSSGDSHYRSGFSGNTPRCDTRLNKDYRMQGSIDVGNQQDIYSILWTVIVSICSVISPFVAFVITSAVSVALFPPKSKMQVFGLLSCCACSFFYVGGFVIDFGGYQSYSQNAKDGIRFACAVPMWMLLQILAVILTKIRYSKDPISKISTDAKKLKNIIRSSK